MSRRRALVCIIMLFIAVMVMPSAYLCHAETVAIPGGFPVALVLDIDGAVIDEVGFVRTSVGNASLGNKLKRGDTITEIDGGKVRGCDEIVDKIESGNGEEMALTILRDGKQITVSVTPYIEDDSGLYKLGVYLRDTVTGVGTVTFARENGFFVALGHKISDPTNSDVPISGGKIYECELVGVTKSKRNDPGELRAYAKGEPIGEIFRSTEYGVYGKFYKRVGGELMPLGNKENVLPGKAYIITTLNEKPEVFEVDIIKATNQSSASPKGMLIRITDKRLLEISGGIVQGMSGSPLLQNGKIVGAVTHVLVNDPTKGYAIYADWLQSA